MPNAETDADGGGFDIGAAVCETVFAAAASAMRIYQKQLPAREGRGATDRRSDRKFRALPCLTRCLLRLYSSTYDLLALAAVVALAHMEGGKGATPRRTWESPFATALLTTLLGDHNLYGFLDCPTVVMCTSFSFSPLPSSPESPRFPRPECLAYKMPLNLGASLVRSVRSGRHPQSPSFSLSALL